MTLEEMMATYPTKWQISGGYVADANGRLVTGIVGDIVVEAVNCVSELTAERDELKAKVEELEARYKSVWQTKEDAMALNSKLIERHDAYVVGIESKIKKIRDMENEDRILVAVDNRRRFEAACAFGASHYGRGMFSAEPSAIAAFAVKYADALLSELAKPKDAAKEGTT